jgi:hypothetical protein
VVEEVVTSDAPSGVVAVCGGLAGRPGRGGHAWVFLHWLLGLRRLGHDVLFIDSSRDGAVHDLHSVMAAFDLAHDYAVLGRDGASVSGLDRRTLLRRMGDDALLVNVMGFLRDPEILAAAARRAFLDIDPGQGQIWRDLGLADVLAGHDAFWTVGANIGSPDCAIPTCGIVWRAIPPPIVLDEWPVAPPGRAFTSVATWRGPYGTVCFDGRTYGSRVHEFRRFAELPRLVDADFELALDIHPHETADLRLLRDSGWRLVNPLRCAGDPQSYRCYVQASRAEICIAQNLYVDTRSGWLSDRSVCYLASGKPVLAQDTGFTRHYPTGEGLLSFTTLEEAAAGVEEIERDYERHSAAARALAEEHFDSDRVLGRISAPVSVR